MPALVVATAGPASQRRDVTVRVRSVTLRGRRRRLFRWVGRAVCGMAGAGRSGAGRAYAAVCTVAAPRVAPLVPSTSTSAPVRLLREYGST